MSRPPRKAVESIRRYCEKTQCRRCIFGAIDRYPERHNFVECQLVNEVPCDWVLDDEPFTEKEIDK